ncbi:MAG: hypothetical protein GX684_01635 [Ruminococcaceae bacterium]|nr:hypothetical protein [Oscillospiraceae bacterium]
MTAIYILGIVGYYESGKFLMQNGLSRRSILISQLLSAAIASAVISICIVGFEFLRISFFSDYVHSFSVYRLLGPEASGLTATLGMLLYVFLLSAFAFLLGFVTYLIFARLPKGTRVIFGLLFGAVMFVLLPICDRMFFGSYLSKNLISFFRWLGAMPSHMSTFLAAASAVLVLVSALLHNRIDLSGGLAVK